jgi:hypothetical protein
MARRFPSNDANDPHKNVCRAAPVHRCSFFQSLTIYTGTTSSASRAAAANAVLSVIRKSRRNQWMAVFMETIMPSRASPIQQS